MADWGLSADEQEKSLSQKIGSINIKSPNHMVPVVKIPAEDSLGNGETDEPEIPLAEASLMRKILHTKLVHTTHDVEVQRKNPSSPLYSVKSFEELNLSTCRILRKIMQLNYVKYINFFVLFKETTLV